MFYVDRFCIYMLKVVFVEIDDIIMDDVVMEIGSVNIGDSVINGKFIFLFFWLIEKFGLIDFKGCIDKFFVLMYFWIVRYVFIYKVCIVF